MSGSSSDALRRAMRKLAQTDAAEVLAQARARARARAAKLIEDALVDALLDVAAQSSSPSGRHESSSQIAPADSSLVSPRPDGSLPGPRSGRAESEGDAWWVYCVLHADDAAHVPATLEGVEPGSRIEVVSGGELAVLVSAVPATEYDDVRLREHLEDLAWVERIARRHEDVLEEVLAKMTIVPLRLCTLYRDRDGVQRLLAENAAELRASLARIDSCAEWGVKVFAGAVSDAVHEDDREREPQPTAERSGATYLMHRRRQREHADHAAELRAACAENVHEQTSACARESKVNPPQHRELHGRDMTMILNGAYLVAHEQASELQAAVARLQTEWGPQGFVIELTGPWPAYNFVSGVMP